MRNVDDRSPDAKTRIVQFLFRNEALTYDERIEASQFGFAETNQITKFLMFLCNNNLKEIAKHMIESLPLQPLEYQPEHIYLTVFAYFCIRNSTDIVEMLLNKGCSVNRLDFVLLSLKVI